MPRSGTNDLRHLDSTASTEGGELRQLLLLLGRRSPLILLAILVAAGAGFLITKIQDTEYTATASLLFQPLALDQQVTGTPLQQSGDQARDALTGVKLVSLEVVRQRAARQLGAGYTAERLKKVIEVEADGQSNLVKVQAVAPTANEAARIANTVAATYTAFRKTQLTGQIQAAADTIRASYLRLDPDDRSKARGQALRLSLEKLRLLKSVTTSEAQVVQPATPPEDPSKPKPVLMTAIGAFIGLIVGLALALVVEQLDRRTRTSDDLGDILGVPVLVQVPRRKAFSYKELVATGGPWLVGGGTAESEPFRRLRTNLRHRGGADGVRSVLMTSVDAEAGKTTVALQLAAASASGDADVLLIEADLRRPQLARLLGEEGHAGLGDLLGRGEHEVDPELVVTVPRPAGSAYGSSDDGEEVAFDVLLAGRQSTEASELIDSEAMRAVLAWAKETYDFVIVDAPPPGLVSDAIPLMDQVDGVLVVSHLGRDPRSSLAQLRDEFRRLEITPVGAVANFSKTARTSGYYYS